MVLVYMFLSYSIIIASVLNSIIIAPVLISIIIASVLIALNPFASAGKELDTRGNQLGHVLQVSVSRRSLQSVGHCSGWFSLVQARGLTPHTSW